MKLYIVSTENYGYDEYDSLVVSADSREDAIEIALNGDYVSGKLVCKIEDINVEYIGEYRSSRKGVVHASYNAG